ncbi:MAG: CCA tRNA nucleotidyltransferase [Hyphomicrobiaceae bacterium]
MTIPGTGDAPDLPTLKRAPWLEAPATQQVLAALSAAGFEGRIVGGAVRNALMGHEVADIDIATPAEPRQVMAAMDKAGLAVVPTGIGHGTVTVVVGRKPYEVTTLRRDVSTDGRRATVAFTHEWEEDARRRDFTINALYCDRNGRLYDPVAGYPDIVKRRVRFIGDADQRIAEDYLRILRFFRFHAAYASGPPDRQGMAAVVRGRKGLAHLSGERIGGETKKLLVAPGACPTLLAMGGHGLVVDLLGMAPRPGLFGRLEAAEAALGEAPDAMLRLSALAIAVEEDKARLATRLRLSNAEAARLMVVDRHHLPVLEGIGEGSARALVYGCGAGQAVATAIAWATVAPEGIADARLLHRVARTFEPPEFPVRGRDLVPLGVRPGRQMGDVIRHVKAWWVARDFPPADEVLRELPRLVAEVR